MKKIDYNKWFAKKTEHIKKDTCLYFGIEFNKVNDKNDIIKNIEKEYSKFLGVCANAMMGGLIKCLWAEYYKKSGDIKIGYSYEFKNNKLICKKI